MGIIYNSLTPTEGLVLSLDTANRRSYPGSGNTWFDLSGNNNHGTLTNGASLNTGPGGGMNFDGVDDYVVGGQLNCRNGSPITIALFTNIRTRVFDVNFGLIDMQTSGNPTLTFQSASLTTGNFIFTDSVNSPNNISVTTSDLPILNKWCHLSIAFLGTAYRYTINGQIVKTGNISGLSGSSQITLFQIGRRSQGATGYANALIDDIRIYNRYLSDAEILILFNSRRRRYGL